MVYGKSEGGYTTDENKLAWDLRMFYTRFISLYMLDFKSAEDSNNYYSMFTNLKRWYSSIKHEWMNEKEDEEFNKMCESLKVLANKYKKTYLGKDCEPVGVEELEESLQRMKEYLLFHMKDSNMFGSTWDDEGL